MIVKINKIKAIEVCKIGQLHECCKYLIAGSEGLQCAKKDTAIKAVIDKRTDMNAKGDNCKD